ncbi:MAG TPA: DEAD/DEAH box helicase [Dehalococcoidia bacterium]|nr:DEAD/DEAH box helicase [Candidatus Woesearchaeota archaeon]HLE80428.1 DEAD/DEAH box helicase [Dehalococcoidia bacterium]
MRLSELKVPALVIETLTHAGMETLRPAQEKAVAAGLLEGKNLLVCTPTASGKTLIAELAALRTVLERKGKALYIVPMKALATEKHREFTVRWGRMAKVALSIGDPDAEEDYLSQYDIIVATSEKVDSLLRHGAPWVSKVKLLVVDEVHLLDDPSRGPTLEILITLLRLRIPELQVLALSATIGNPEELAAWLDAALVQDDWRPVQLLKGIYRSGTIKFDAP